MRTPIFPTRARAGGEAGFTLIELLAVLTILAIAITAFTMNGRSGLQSAKFRSFLVHTVAAIDQTHADAMRGMAEKVFYVDVRNRRLSYPASGEILELPPGVSLNATVAQAEQYKDGSAGIRFYPAGGSSGGVLAFAFAGQTYEVRVNWLTGNATLVRI